MRECSSDRRWVAGSWREWRPGLIELDTTARGEFQAKRRQDLPRRARDRLETGRLVYAGWDVARIADHLDRGRVALLPPRPGPALDTARREHVAGQIRNLLGEDRT